MEQYLIYLRKSRKDRDMEFETGIFDTLQRHRDTLLRLAEKHDFAVSKIFEEVVSGDTIAERPEMQKLLCAVESGIYAGVLVMEVPRLARGNTRDQGTVAETFKYSNTKIITPDKIYDPSDEADEEYFEFGLFMSRREYMSINRRLQRGRMVSLHEGKYIAGLPPYGYVKKKIQRQKGYTLEIDPETSDVVRNIFELYTVGCTNADGTVTPIGSSAIANLLNAKGIPSPGGIKWSASAVRDILKNPTYAGYVRWSYRPQTKQMVNGVLMTSCPVSKEYTLEKGLHEAIISEQTWSLAKAAMSRHSHAPVPSSKQIANPLAGLLYCSQCGHSLVQVSGGRNGVPYLSCPTPHCPTMGSRRDVVEQLLLDGVCQWLSNYRLQLHELTNSGHTHFSHLKKEIAASERILNKLIIQKNSLYNFLEQGIYSQDLFLERSNVLNAKIHEVEHTVQCLHKNLSLLEESRKTDALFIPEAENVLSIYTSLDEPADQNELLKSILDHVVYSKSVGGQWKRSDLQLYLYPKIPHYGDDC